MFLLVPAYPGCPGSKAVKRSLLLLLLATHCDTGGPTNTKLNPTNPILTIIDTEEGILQTSEIAS